jgi:hypothetical protein
MAVDSHTARVSVVSHPHDESNRDSRRPVQSLPPGEGDPLAGAAGTSKRKARGTSPTQRSLKHWRGLGYLCDVVERRLPRGFVTKDLYGFIDILAVKDEDIVGVQTTSSGNLAARVDKITSHENYPIVIRALRIVVEGWRKNAAGKWVRREVEL